MSLLTNALYLAIGKRVVPGEAMRQQYNKEHDANQPQILSHIGNCDLRQVTQK